VLARFLPTSRDIARINSSLVRRHANLSRLIRSLNLLNTALAQRGPQITQLVQASAQVFNAYATESGNLQRAISDLPGTLHQTTQTLGKVQSFAGVLGSATQALTPVAGAIVKSNPPVTNFAKKTTPIIRNQIRPFVIDSRPLVRALKPAAQNLATATPHLTDSFVVLNHLFNLLAYNPSGANAPPSDPNRDEGYLFWIAWLGHNGASVFANSDANGIYRALTEESTCATLSAEANNIGGAQGGAAGAALLGVLGNVLMNPTVCGPGGIGGGLGNLIPPLPTKRGANAARAVKR
jgi:phospholipid/cholesterol/gamma-HCH transport system substrate-binding protein